MHVNASLHRSTTTSAGRSPTTTSMDMSTVLVLCSTVSADANRLRSSVRSSSGRTTLRNCSGSESAVAKTEATRPTRSMSTGRFTGTTITSGIDGHRLRCLMLGERSLRYVHVRNDEQGRLEVVDEVGRCGSQQQSLEPTPAAGTGNGQFH